MTTLVDRGSPRTLVGYSWPWTVRPGARVDFMVSCDREGPYQADLVRLICADGLSARDRFKEKVVSAPFSGTYSGHFQPTHPGSYVEIDCRSALDGLSSFTVQAVVCPTLLPGGVRLRFGGIANSWEEPVFQDQHLISRWDTERHRGWALLIDAHGRPAFMIGDGEQVRSAVLDRPLIQDRWFLLVACVEAQRGIVRIAAQPIACGPGELSAWPPGSKEERSAGELSVPQVGPLRFAACTAGQGNGARLKAAQCFNGRLDRVRVTAGPLDMVEAVAMTATECPSRLVSRVVGFWDFAKHTERVDIVDLSPNALHGVAVNAPARAVRGVDWDGSVNDWPVRPDHFSAIHFHDDDLYDAEWKPDFTYTVPEDLPSGIYAARLRQGESEEYMPFVVAPPKNETRAPIALLLPTLTYTAYTNVTGLTTLKRTREITERSGERLIEEDLHPDLLQSSADAAYLLEHHRRLGKGIYANHSDGTLSSVASQRHPNMTIKPNGINWTLVADTYLTDWLEQKNIPYDVITDDLLHAEGAELLQPYAVVLTGNHPEYCTRRMLQAIERYQRTGGRLMYLGGNGFYWVTSVHSQLPGLIEVRKEIYAGHWLQCENRHAFDGEKGGRWETNGRPPAMLSGVNYVSGASYAMEGGAPYRRLPDSYRPDIAFVFEGVATELIGNYGVFGGGAAGQEVDRRDPERGTPAHALHLARADVFARYGSMVADEYRSNTSPPIADLMLFETPNGGAVFSVGSMSWTGALSHNGYENDISRITENVLRRFVERKPLQLDRGVRA